MRNSGIKGAYLSRIKNLHKGGEKFQNVFKKFIEKLALRGNRDHYLSGT